MMISRLRITAFATSLLLVVACEERFNPTIARTPLPPIEAPPPGLFELREVDARPLPHTTTMTGTNYTLLSGNFTFFADSTWSFVTNSVLTAANGAFIGNSPAAYGGTWQIKDTVINLTASVPFGWLRVRDDTLFWRGGPKKQWEDTLTFTMVRK